MPSNSAPAKRAFKKEGMYALVTDYVKRISHYSPCKMDGGLPKEGAAVWACDRGDKAKRLSSEEIAGKLAELLQTGKDLEVVIGGPDGLSADEIESLKPSLRLSFGPMTLPHELAAVVASEQLYRAWTIIKKTPYHLKH